MRYIGVGRNHRTAARLPSFTQQNNFSRCWFLNVSCVSLALVLAGVGPAVEVDEEQEDDQAVHQSCVGEAFREVALSHDVDECEGQQNHKLGLQIQTGTSKVLVSRYRLKQKLAKQGLGENGRC